MTKTSAKYVLAQDKVLDAKLKIEFLVERDLRFSYPGIVQSLCGSCVKQTASTFGHNGEPLRVLCEADFVDVQHNGEPLRVLCEADFVDVQHNGEPLRVLCEADFVVFGIV